jgi:hypothetical protein
MEAMNYFTDAMVNGIPLLFVVLGLVEWIKTFGLTGNVLRGVSMAVGLLLGFGYMTSQQGFPVEFAAIFGYVVYGLALGLVASGIYDGGKRAVGSAIRESVDIEIE